MNEAAPFVMSLFLIFLSDAAFSSLSFIFIPGFLHNCLPMRLQFQGKFFSLGIVKSFVIVKSFAATPGPYVQEVFESMKTKCSST